MALLRHNVVERAAQLFAQPRSNAGLKRRPLGNIEARAHMAAEATPIVKIVLLTMAEFFIDFITLLAKRYVLSPGCNPSNFVCALPPNGAQKCDMGTAFGGEISRLQSF